VVDASLVSLAFGLGFATFFSPCGLPMLPAYIAYYLPRGDDATRVGPARAAARGLGAGVIAAAGAVLVLGLIIGGAFALGAPFKRNIIHFEAVGGLILLVLGVLILTGKGPSFTLPVTPSQKKGAAGLFSFGALYAGVGASCSGPIIIGAVTLFLAQDALADTLALAGAFVAGFVGIFVGITVLIATSQDTLVTRIRRLIPHIERITGVVLVLVGSYLLYYWARVEIFL